MPPKLSVIIPVYNERSTIQEVIRRVHEVSIAKEIIIVDDFSSDGTREWLKNLSDPQVTVLFHERNMGKGAAIRSGLAKAAGEIILIQDADLEYSPKDYPELLKPILEDHADVVYGSRFLGGPHRVLFFWHYMGNVLFTFIANMLYNINLSDMGTCYKVFRADVIKKMKLKSDRFGFEPEVTAKVCKQHLRLYEVPISYYGRTYAEGKKITWRDGFVYLWCLLKFRFMD